MTTNESPKTMTFEVTYSHAAPFIRRAAAYAMSRAVSSSTQRDARRAHGEADGLMHALSILLKSPAGANEPGEIADVESIPTDALQALFDRYGRRDFFDADVLPVVPVGISRLP
jgi:hypothetical protein